MTGRIICPRDDCTKRCTHVPRLVVPYAGVLAQAKTPAMLLINLQLCEKHVHEWGRGFKWDDQPAMRKGMQQAAGPPLDFAAATVEPEPIGSPLHLRQIEMQERAKRQLASGAA